MMRRLWLAEAPRRAAPAAYGEPAVADRGPYVPLLGAADLCEGVTGRLAVGSKHAHSSELSLARTPTRRTRTNQAL